jgi:hypothetical protein
MIPEAAADKSRYSPRPLNGPRLIRRTPVRRCILLHELRVPDEGGSQIALLSRRLDNLSN